MAYPLPGEQPFAIDGTGRVIRTGDEVIVNPRRSLWTSGGPAVVIAVQPMSNLIEVRFPFDEDAFCHSAEVRRADDHERTPHGDPLWYWL